jgi:hypothetical protein
MGCGYAQTGTFGADLEPLFEALDTQGFRDIGRQALRATETIAQSVRSRNRQYRAVAVQFGGLGSFHRHIAVHRAQQALRQFSAVEDLIDEIRNDPQWRTDVLPRLDEALAGRGGELLHDLVHEARIALLDIEHLSGKTIQEFLAIIRPYGSAAESFDNSFDSLLGRFRQSVDQGSLRAGHLALEPVPTGTVEAARTICVETGIGLLAIGVVVSTTVPTWSAYQFPALVRLLPTVLSACSAIAAEAPTEPPPS